MPPDPKPEGAAAPPGNRAVGFPKSAAPSTSGEHTTTVNVEVDGYATPWEAAFAALSKYNPQSILSKKKHVPVPDATGKDTTTDIDTGIEFGGLIYKKGTRFFFTEAVRGESDGDNAPAAVEVWSALDKVPEDSHCSIVGDYHTHGGKNPNKPPGEQFSGSPLVPEDTLVDDGSGKVRIYDAAVMMVWRQHQNGGTPISQMTKKEIQDELQVARDTLAMQKKSGDEGGAQIDLVKRKSNILDVTTYSCFLGTPEGRFGIYIPALDPSVDPDQKPARAAYEFYTSPDSRLLPPGQPPPPAGYAH